MSRQQLDFLPRLTSGLQRLFERYAAVERESYFARLERTSSAERPVYLCRIEFSAALASRWNSQSSSQIFPFVLLLPVIVNPAADDPKISR